MKVFKVDRKWKTLNLQSNLFYLSTLPDMKSHCWVATLLFLHRLCSEFYLEKFVNSLSLASQPTIYIRTFIQTLRSKVIAS